MSVSLNERVLVPSSSDFIYTDSEHTVELPVRLSKNAATVLNARYLKKDETGKVSEEPRDMFLRVAGCVAEAEKNFGGDDMVKAAALHFFNMMATGEFLPNSPTLMNAGRELGQLSACFVLPVEDSMDSIFQAVKDAAIIHKSGGGTGFSFSRLRPKNDVVRTTRGISSGPVSFMAVFDAATETIKQGGTRRGANMGILRVDHPDILEFINAKRDKRRFTNFNISVALTDDFMEAVRNDTMYNLVSPRIGQTIKQENARTIFDLIVQNAHDSGDPGAIFIDRINQANTVPHLGAIESTNPCGEQPLLPYESCNLGSINLSLMAKEHKNRWMIDWDKLGRITRLGVRFLDNIIEINKFPLETIAEETMKTRKIGLGVMGFADMLIRLGIPYDSEDAERTAEQVMSFINRESKNESAHLAEQRGVFPAYEGSVFSTSDGIRMRNATTTTIAPTGTISIIASCSSGIEPLYAIAYKRNVLDGRQLAEFHPAFLEMAEKEGIKRDTLENELMESGGNIQCASIPDSMKRLFRTALDIPVEWHIRIQAAFQRYTDNAVSKTVNFPREATCKDVSDAYMQAYDAGLKGITIYRDGSRVEQVLVTSGKKESQTSSGSRHSIEPRPRPLVTTGATEKIVTGCGNLYVTVNKDESGLCEVFCQMGRSGGCTSSQSEAISRLISLALRSGVKLEEIVAQLKGIRCPSPMWHNGTVILSCSDAIATALSRYLDNKNDKKSSEFFILSQDADSVELNKAMGAGKKLSGEMAGVCQDCGGILEYSEGCMVCRTCGFSKCG